MLKLFCLALMIFVLNKESSSISIYTVNPVLKIESWIEKYDAKVDFNSYIGDFLGLIDLEKLIGVAIKYINDPEVLQFLGFIFSPQLNELVLDFESIEEFKEAIAFLELKGYNAHYITDILNSALNLPPFEMSKMSEKTGKGVNALIVDLIASLPLDDMKTLFEDKLETSPEVAELFDMINSEEFLGILRRMSQNPKFLSIKATLESYGFDFNYICQAAIEILGDYY